MKSPPILRALIMFLLLFLFLVILPIFIIVKLKMIELIMAWLTLLAVLVALFKDQIVTLFFSPVLEITASTDSYYFHEVETTAYHLKQAWFGVGVDNIGLANAKNVMLYWSGIKSNVVNDFSNYRNLPLRKGWIGGTLIEVLPPRTGSIRFDICSITKNTTEKINFSFPSTPNALGEVICSSNPKSYFEFLVTAVADNAKTQRVKVRIEYDGKYMPGFSVVYKKLSRFSRN